MTPKSTWLEKLVAWRKSHVEHYARAILSPPRAVPMLQAIPSPSLILIMGLRGGGKTGVGHEIAHRLYLRKGLPAICHLDGAPTSVAKKVQSMIPDFFRVTTDKSQWPHNCVVVYDEAARNHHARRSQTNDAVEMEGLMGISRQKNQIILFLTHHSRKLDINIVRDVDCIQYKQPLYSHAMWERDELSDITWKAQAFFASLRTERARQRGNLVVNFHDFTFQTFNNALPPWWSDELSCLFKDIEIGGDGKKTKKKKGG